MLYPDQQVLYKAKLLLPEEKVVRDTNWISAELKAYYRENNWKIKGGEEPPWIFQIQ